jgi:maleylpyruvate isomerase
MNPSQGMAMKLYNFFRSSTSHRLRIALNLKGLDYEYVPIDLRTEQHLGAEYKALNPQGLVPALVDNGRVLIQSPAIIEWLEERYPAPALLPADLEARARVRALAAIVGCDMHPVNNRRILEALRHDFGADEAAVQRWCATWIATGFDAIEALLAADTQRGEFCFGSVPTLADVYLVPQVESARRFKLDIGRWPRVLAIHEACAQIEAFRRAVPAEQPDAS